MHPIYRQCEFQCASVRLSQLPPEGGREVAFAGRSNAGKSSAINALVGRVGLARTSKTPGRTQAIHFYPLDPEHRLVDLPGYGYAKAPAELVRKWSRLVGGYLAKRRSLAGAVLVMDARRPLMVMDRQLLDWCLEAGLPVHIVLTKADKLSRSVAARTLTRVRAELAGMSRHPTAADAQLFSATKAIGIEELGARLDAWLRLAP